MCALSTGRDFSRLLTLRRRESFSTEYDDAAFLNDIVFSLTAVTANSIF